MPPPNRPPNRIKWYILILLVTLAIPSALLPLILRNGRPAFESLDAIEPAQIEKLELRFFNIQTIVPAGPDGVKPPDTIGPFALRPEDIPTMLMALKGARPIPSMPPTPWLGEYRFTMADGKKQTVRIRFGTGDPDNGIPHRIFFQINRELNFETMVTVNELVAKALEAEKRAKGN